MGKYPSGNPPETKTPIHKLSELKIKQFQHEIKNHIQQFSKDNVGKGSDYVKCTIFEDMMILRGEGFLTELEKYVARTPSGSEKIKASRIEVIERSDEEFRIYLEQLLEAKELHRVYNVEPHNNFWMDIHVFDRRLTE